MFVAHDGEKALRIDMLDLSDFGLFAQLMGALLEKNIVDPELRRWILPAFSTTTRDDSVVASILMMGTLQKYFSYTCGCDCGLPSVTLLGTEGDWENILSAPGEIGKLWPGADHLVQLAQACVEEIPRIDPESRIR